MFGLFKRTNKRIVYEKARFNLWQSVWTIRDNKPIKARIVAVSSVGRYNQFKCECYASTSYRLNLSCGFEDWLSVDYFERDMHASFEDLMNHIMEADKCTQ